VTTTEALSASACYEMFFHLYQLVFVDAMLCSTFPVDTNGQTQIVSPARLEIDLEFQ
jgi:hypothetical protein